MIMEKQNTLCGLGPWRPKFMQRFASRKVSVDTVHKVRIYKEYHTVCPLVGIGTLPTPLSPASVPLPPEAGGGHSPAGEGLGESQFRRLEKKLSTLPTLWHRIWTKALDIYDSRKKHRDKNDI